MSEPVLAWHFTGATLRDGRPVPAVGVTLCHRGPLELCSSGLHASERVLDATKYAPGAMLHRVRCGGTIKRDKDKLVCRERTILASVDATRVLQEFACCCATQALDAQEARGVAVDARSRRAIEVKLLWLDGKATDQELAAARDAAWAAAWDAAWAAAWAAARDAARAAARDAAWAAAWAAARDAAWAAAWAAARDAAWAAARDAARDAAWAAQETELRRRVFALLAEHGYTEGAKP